MVPRALMSLDSLTPFPRFPHPAHIPRTSCQVSKAFPNAAQDPMWASQGHQPLPQGHLSRASLQLPRPWLGSCWAEPVSQPVLVPREVPIAQGLGCPGSWLWQGSVFSLVTESPSYLPCLVSSCSRNSETNTSSHSGSSASLSPVKPPALAATLTPQIEN